MRNLIAVLLLAGALTSCAGKPPIGGSDQIQVVDSRALPPPTARSALIGPYDKLSVNVFGVEELSVEEVQTDASGRISVPLVGSIEAAGKTSAELAVEIEDGLRALHVRNPRVAVNLTETVSQSYTVDGEVKKPGPYAVAGQTSLMRAVASAEGANEFADLQQVVVFRTVGAQRMVALYNLGAIRRGAYEDPAIYANDVVVVGNSSARRLFRDVLQIAPSLTYPIIAIFQGRN